MLTKLIPLSGISLRRPCWNRVIAFDASEQAGVVVFAETTAVWIARLTDVAFQGSTKSTESQQIISRFVKVHNWVTAFVHDGEENSI